MCVTLSELRINMQLLAAGEDLIALFEAGGWE